jgi:hypothetical protein
LYGSAKRGDGLRQMTRLGARNAEFQMYGRRVRQLATERFQDLESLRSAAPAPLSGAQDETGSGMRRIDVQNFPCLFRGEIGILL